jgi:hypothetical protein
MLEHPFSLFILDNLEFLIDLHCLVQTTTTHTHTYTHSKCYSLRVLILENFKFFMKLFQYDLYVCVCVCVCTRARAELQGKRNLWLIAVLDAYCGKFQNICFVSVVNEHQNSKECILEIYIDKIRICGSSVSIVTRLRPGRPAFNSRQRLEFKVLTTLSRPALVPIQPPIQFIEARTWSWPLTSI